MSGGKGDAGTGGSIEALLQKLRDALTCNRFGGGHYCPNCDHGFGPQLVDDVAAALLTRRDQPEPTRGRYDMNEPKREGAELLAFLDIAHDELSALCKGKRFRMSVPVQKDDSDMILGDALRDAKAYIVKLEAAATRRDAPQEQMDKAFEKLADAITDAELPVCPIHVDAEFVCPECFKAEVGRDADPAQEPGNGK